MKRITILTILLIATYQLYAQVHPQPDTLKSYYSLNKIYWANPWLSSGNASGMVLNKDAMKGFSSFSDAGLVAGYETGALRNIYDPASTLLGGFNIISYSKLGDVFLSGNFSYDYSQMKESRWRGLIDPYETPFMMTDSIPGNLSLEMYHMGAGIAVPFGNFSFGIKADYKVGLMAKHKDLRNKNTYMNFDISPGIMYRSDFLKAGLNIGYIRNTEKIEYTQVDKNSEKYMFDLYGLWLYYSTGFSSAETSRLKENTSYYGAFQLDFDFGNWRLFDDFRSEYKVGKQGETGYNNLSHGDIFQLTFTNSLKLQYGLQHLFKADLSSYRLSGQKYLQRQELDPDSKVRVWKSYGSPINCYIRDYLEYDLNYTYRRAYSATDVKWEATLGYQDSNMNHKYKVYPITFSQNYDIRQIYLSYTKYWVSDQSLFDLTPIVSYFFADGTSNLITNAENNEPVQAEKEWQLTPQLEEEYLYFHSPKISAGISFKYSLILNDRKVSKLYFNFYYKIKAATDGPLNNDNRHYSGLSIGYAF